MTPTSSNKVILSKGVHVRRGRNKHGRSLFIQTVELEMFILSDFTVSHLLSVYLSL